MPPRFVAIFAIAFLASLPQVAVSATVLEALIRQQSPCAGLRASTPLGPVGLDRFRQVRVPAVDLSIRDNDLSLSATGSLICATPDVPLFKGYASATISVRASVELGSCKVKEIDVALSRFGGMYGPALRSFSDQIRSRLSRELVKSFGSLCAGTKGP